MQINPAAGDCGAVDLAGQRRREDAHGISGRVCGGKDPSRLAERTSEAGGATFLFLLMILPQSRRNKSKPWHMFEDRSTGSRGLPCHP